MPGASRRAARPRGVLGRAAAPLHRGLLGAAPRLDGPRGTRLATVAGAVPDRCDPPEGCRFTPRCPFRIAGLRHGAAAPRASRRAIARACHRAPLDGMLDAA